MYFPTVRYTKRKHRWLFLKSIFVFIIFFSSCLFTPQDLFQISFPTNSLSTDYVSQDMDTSHPSSISSQHFEPTLAKTSSVGEVEFYDVVIIGSELEGLYLAKAAYDEGLKVKIIDPRNGFGGQLLQAEMFFLDETTDDAGNTLVQGRIKDLFKEFKIGRVRTKAEFTSYVSKLVKNIPIELGITLKSIVTEPGVVDKYQITSLLYENQSSVTKEIRASYWVDNTDYAALMSRLEVKRLPGLEEFHKLKQTEYMSAGLMMKFKNVNWTKFQQTVNSMSSVKRNERFGPAYINSNFAINFSGMSKKYTASNSRVFLRGLNALNQRNGNVIINALLIYGIDPSIPSSIKEALSLGANELPAILTHFQKTLPGWEKAELNDVPDYPYIREYNHYEMDYVLQPSDLLGGRMFADNVSIGGYPLDLQGVTSSKWGISMGKPDKYGMPLRSFMLKNYENVIAAGKNVGSTAIAYGSTRIQSNTALAAENIGIILGQINGKKKLKQLDETDMRAMQAYIKKVYKINLSGITSHNKLTGWSEEEIRKLNIGQIVYPDYINKKK